MVSEHNVLFELLGLQKDVTWGCVSVKKLLKLLSSIVGHYLHSRSNSYKSGPVFVQE